MRTSVGFFKILDQKKSSYSLFEEHEQNTNSGPDSDVINFTCSTQLSMKFILLINVMNFYNCNIFYFLLALVTCSAELSM